MYRIKLNSELIFVLGLVLGPQPGPRPNIYFFSGEKSVHNTKSNFISTAKPR